jgi:hypothetical protein
LDRYSGTAIRVTRLLPIVAKACSATAPLYSDSFFTFKEKFASSCHSRNDLASRSFQSSVRS